MKNALDGSNTTSCHHGEPTWRVSGTAIEIIGYSLIVFPVFTVVLNLLEVVFVVRAPKLWTHTRVFLITLAFCDVILGFTVMPYKILEMIKGDKLPFGKTGCDVGTSLEVMLTAATIWILCALAFERCIALCSPFNLGYWFGRRNGLRIFATCLAVPAVLSFGLILPHFHVRGLEDVYTCVTEQIKLCKFISNIYYSVTVAAFGFLIPAIISFICNHKTNSAIIRRQQVFLKLANINTKRASFNRHYFGMTFSRTIVTMTNMCFIFLLPFFTLVVVDPIITFRTPRVIWIVVTWFSYSHSVVIPILYLKGTKVFRFRSFLCV